MILRRVPAARHDGFDSRHREPIPVRTRCDADMSCKRRAQVFFAGESATPRDLLDSVVGLLERTSCGIDAHAFNRSGWTLFARLSVAAGEISGTHAGALCEAFNTKIGGQVFRDPAFQLSKRVARRLRLSGEERAVLRLSTHPPEIDYEDSRHVHGDGSPTILLDERERQVDACRHAS